MLEVSYPSYGFLSCTLWTFRLTGGSGPALKGAVHPEGLFVTYVIKELVKRLHLATDWLVSHTHCSSLICIRYVAFDLLSRSFPGCRLTLVECRLL